MTQKKADMATHSPSALADSAAVNLLQFILHIHGKVAARLYSRDTWPNIDGHIEVLADDGQPLGVIWAQVKGLPENHALKFPCPTELLTFAENLNLPIFLLGVDLREERVYWNYYDADIVKELPYANKQTLTVRFHAERSFTRYDTSYVEAWKQLITKRNNGRDGEARRNASSTSLFGFQTDKDIYYAKLLMDPFLTDMQVLQDISYPVSISTLYIKQRVRERTRLSYQLNPNLQNTHDPLDFIAWQERLREQQRNLAKDPVAIIETSTLKRFAIVGDSGAGKTTLLKYLVFLSLKREREAFPSLPIFVNLNKFAESGESDLSTFIVHTWEQDYNIHVESDSSFLHVHLWSGDALVLLDALDETVLGDNEEAAETSYQRVEESIQRFCTCYEKVLVIVTARKESYRLRRKLAGFVELELLDFSTQEIHQFLQKWFVQSNDPQKRIIANRSQKLLEQHLRISTLAANPLLLTLIACLLEDHLSLPEGRAQLYQQCVDALLSKWDKKKLNLRRRQVLQPENQKQLLSEIAWHFHRQGARYFPKKELVSIIHVFLRKKRIKSLGANIVLRDISSENGLLREQAHELFGFLHLAFQEYFTAQYLIDQNDIDLLLHHLGFPWWDEVVLLSIEQMNDASHLLSHLISFDNQDEHPEDIFFTKLIFAGRCLARCSFVGQIHLREEIIHRLFEIFLHTSYSLVREQIAETLVEIGNSSLDRDLKERLLSLLLTSWERAKV